jgi:hypothetical protein
MINPNHDPILRAGLTRCRDCGRIAYPTDAVFLDGDLILVTYAMACEHMPSGTAVIDMATIPVIAVDPNDWLSGRRCAGRTVKGRQCRAYARPGSLFCAAHPVNAGNRSS